jgi:hypothetical protein
MPGGTSTQMLTVGRSYPEPFALIGCGVLLKDPLRCDGIPAVHVEIGATSPEHPAGSGVRLYFQEIAVAGSQSSPGWLVQGSGRFFEAVGGSDSMFGMTVVGDGNTLHNVTVERNATGGVVLQGNGNALDGVHAYTNSGPAGVQVTGDGNRVVGSAVGDRGRGNDGTGILVAGRSNLVSGNTVLSNGGDGINVSGGTASQPNVVKLNVSGSPVGGNHGIGLVLGGVGNGSAGPIEVEGNTVQTNVMGGIRVTGSGHQLKNNVSGGFLNLDNTGCNYSVAPGNLNAGGNKAKYLLIPGVSTPFPTICIH